MACCRAILKASFLWSGFCPIKGDIHPETSNQIVILWLIFGSIRFIFQVAAFEQHPCPKFQSESNQRGCRASATTAACFIGASKATLGEGIQVRWYRFQNKHPHFFDAGTVGKGSTPRLQPRLCVGKTREVCRWKGQIPQRSSALHRVSIRTRRYEECCCGVHGPAASNKGDAILQATFHISWRYFTVVSQNLWEMQRISGWFS